MSPCFPGGKAKLLSLSAWWEFSKSTWIIQGGFDLSADGHRHKLFPEPAGKQYSWHFSPPATSPWHPILGQQLSQLPLYWQLSDMFGVSGDPTVPLCATRLPPEKHGGAWDCTQLLRSPFRDGWDCPWGGKVSMSTSLLGWNCPWSRGKGLCKGCLGSVFGTVWVGVDLLCAATREGDDRSFYQVSVVSLLLPSFSR